MIPGALPQVTRDWDMPNRIAERAVRLASLFDGEHYVLSLLADIHPGFKSIVRAHTELVVQKKPWTPLIYKVTGFQRIIYLIGTCHFRWMNQNENDVLVKYQQAAKGSKAFEERRAVCVSLQAKTILSKKIQQILRNSSFFAIEHFVDHQNLLKKLGRIEEKRASMTPEEDNLQDKFEQETILCNLQLMPNHQMGLESSAFQFLTHNDENKQLKFYPADRLPMPLPLPRVSGLIERAACNHDNVVPVVSLHSAGEYLQASQELEHVRILPADLDDIIQICDIVYSGSEESSKQFLTPKKGSPYEQHLKWSNQAMCNALKDIVMHMQYDRSMTAMVGADHLYGEHGLLAQLTDSGFTVTVLKKDIDPPIQEEFMMKKEISTFIPNSECAIL